MKTTDGHEVVVMYDDAVVKAFLDNQLKLFPEPVAEDEVEAREFLEDLFAVVCEDVDQVREYLDEGSDISGMSDEELLEAEEVFAVGDGRYLIVEG